MLEQYNAFFYQKYAYNFSNTASPVMVDKYFKTLKYKFRNVLVKNNKMAKKIIKNKLCLEISKLEDLGR